MKKGCLFAVIGAVALFVLLLVIGIVANLSNPETLPVAEEQSEPEPKSEPLNQTKEPEAKEPMASEVLPPGSVAETSSEPERVKPAVEEAEPEAATIFDPRTWTSADGERTFYGTLTKLGDGELTVEKDGEPITFAIEKLSPADREFLGQGVSITTLDGTTHESGSVSRISAESILFKKDSGPVQIAMENLPEEMRDRFGYDAEIAAKLKEAREKQAAALRERQAAAAAQQSAQDNLDSFMAVLEAAGVGNELVSSVSTKGETISITVSNGWHYQPKQIRQQSAQILWQTWAMIYAPNDLDKARLSLRDSVGNEVGGSRWLAGSLIWVKD